MCRAAAARNAALRHERIPRGASRAGRGQEGPLPWAIAAVTPIPPQRSDALDDRKPPMADIDCQPPAPRRVFCNRTLNMRAIQAIGYDMDYTLVHYDVPVWEARAYAHVQERLQKKGYPVADLRFDPEQFSRGLVIDRELGNIVKCNRFGYIVRAAHGTRILDHKAQRAVYGQVWVDLREPRWVFLNTLFSLSEACLYGQMVELLDAGQAGDIGYGALYDLVRETMDTAHLEGELKAEIIADPERFVTIDEDLVQALLDQKAAGKRLFLATNSEWHYTLPMMNFVFDRHLGPAKWQDLFELVIVQTRKPSFFDGEAPFFAIDEQGAVVTGQHELRAGGRYRGGNARLLQEYLGCGGESILYVGDHMYADVHVSSRIRRWRTALVLRELEDEIQHEQDFAAQQQELYALMQQKERIDREQALLRLSLQRLERGAAPPPSLPETVRTSANPEQAIVDRLKELRHEGEALDHRISPLAIRAGEVGHKRWGPIMRAGNDKSLLARQIEGHADVYMSRVSNLMHLSPYGYLRAVRGSLPHDQSPR
jgi:5'-nucleotidase